MTFVAMEQYFEGELVELIFVIRDQIAKRAEVLMMPKLPSRVQVLGKRKGALLLQI